MGNAVKFLPKNKIESLHTDFDTANVKIIAINFGNNKMKWKISESLWIKDLRPILNVQQKSIPRKLFK